MDLPPRPRACLGEHRASHTGGTALLTSAQSWVDVGFACSAERRRLARVRVGTIELEHLPCRTRWWVARSDFPPSSRTGLFVIGEH